ncbi:Ig-like domain-containing protein [Rubrobacter radiotolerans]|uniref:Ig-like domain-containing protein n=1 Tax=Rubrobacter radiotolerans TaxID=42256 RepID=A0AB35T0T9_RUBRA|nr:Ig-like domain-containing protein [Rubrobacter radiotolerans]MDX5892918.1 Ig-like domain-containing protein [Rubrobacter radiotolerans]
MSKCYPSAVGFTFTVTLASLVFLCLSASEVRSAEDETVYTEKERALLEEGAREIMGLDENETTRLLRDPEAASYVPVKTKTTSRYVNPPPDTGSGSALGSLSTASSSCVGQRKAKKWTVQLVDIDDQPQMRFTVTKVWCFSGGEVTYGKKGPAETWVRSDLRHTEQGGGWRYSPTSEFGTERFLSYRGNTRGAHKSSRAGAFLFYRPGNDAISTTSKVGVNQIGFSTGGCNTTQFEPVVPLFAAGPTGTVASRDATLRFSAGEGAGLQCSLDGAGFKRCTSPARLTGLNQGFHVFKVRAVAPNGDASVIVKREWTVNTQSPAVVSVSPAAGAVGVTANSPVKATFSKPMDELSFYGGNFRLVESGTGTNIDGAIFYNAKSKTAILDPFGDLTPGASYTATIQGGSNGVSDTTGLTLARSKSWSFTVGGL